MASNDLWDEMGGIVDPLGLADLDDDGHHSMGEYFLAEEFDDDFSDKRKKRNSYDDDEEDDSDDDSDDEEDDEDDDDDESLCVKRCVAILDDNFVAGNYLTLDGDFLFVQAIQDNFKLPFEFPVEDTSIKTFFPDFLEEMAVSDPKLLFECWAGA